MAISTTPRHPRRDLKGRPLSDSQGDAPIFSQEELMALCSSCIRYQPQTEHDLVQIMQWAEKVRIDHGILTLLLQGKVGAAWVDEAGDLVVGRI